jgi:hypothetical protein
MVAYWLFIFIISGLPHGKTQRSFNMKNKALMSFILLAFVTAGATFAQSPTLDKLRFYESTDKKGYYVQAVNNRVSGVVIIPDTYQGKPVTRTNNGSFQNMTGITNVTIPASVTNVSSNAFQSCTNLTSVTFGGSATALGQGGTNASFPGDLDTKYKAGGAGTYTRQAGGTVWTKQAVVANTSLDGYWQRSDGLAITISGNTAVITWIGSTPYWVDAQKKGYVKVGDQKLRNIRSTGNLTWSMEELSITYETSTNVAKGTQWVNSTYTMSANGQTLSENGVVCWERERVFNN